jgi:hypothetical protein
MFDPSTTFSLMNLSSVTPLASGMTWILIVTVHGVASRAGAEVAVGDRGKRSNPVAS